MVPRSSRTMVADSSESNTVVCGLIVHIFSVYLSTFEMLVVYFKDDWWMYTSFITQFFSKLREPLRSYPKERIETDCLFNGAACRVIWSTVSVANYRERNAAFSPNRMHGWRRQMRTKFGVVYLLIAIKGGSVEGGLQEDLKLWTCFPLWYSFVSC